MKALGVVTARSGSKRFPGKNLAILGGKTLVARAVEVGRETCEDVVTSTDCPEIAASAMDAGSGIVWRPHHLSGDDVGSLPVVLQATYMAACMMDKTWDAVVLLQPTSPLRTADDVRSCLQLMEEKNADTAVSVTYFETKETLFRVDRFGRITDDHEGQRWFTPNGAVYVLRWNWLMNGGGFYGPRCCPYHMPRERSVDIDYPSDLEAAIKEFG